MKKRKPRVFDSLAAAAKGIPLPMAVLKAAKAAGCPAFRSNRVYADELVRWLAKHPEVLATVGTEGDPKAQKLFEEIRKLRIANDAKEGRLVERAWVAERIQRAAGELNAIRLKSEAEHPMRFAAAGNDVPMCRTITRGMWDEITTSIQTLSKHFAE